jgi:hypothetical protein
MHKQILRDYLLNKNSLEFNDKLLGLLKALVGIIVTFFIIFLFAYLLPVILRITDEPEIKSLGESFVEVAEGMGAVRSGNRFGCLVLHCILACHRKGFSLETN